MKFPDEHTEEEHIKTKLKFQEIYIRLLESEIFRMAGEKELDLIRQEADYSNNTSIRLKVKFDAVYMLCERLQKGIDDIKIPSSLCPLNLDLPNHFPPPPHYQLPRVANIGMYDQKPFHKSVILKWRQGDIEMGNALYLDSKERLSMEMIGYLIEKFFHDMCSARIKTLKGEKLNDVPR